MNKVIQLLKGIHDLLLQKSFTQKMLLSIKEASIYLDIDEQTLYNLNCKKKIPHYKPNGKKVYYKRDELDDWVFKNRISSNEESSKDVEQEFSKVESFLSSNSISTQP